MSINKENVNIAVVWESFFMQVLKKELDKDNKVNKLNAYSTYIYLSNNYKEDLIFSRYKFFLKTSRQRKAKKINWFPKLNENPIKQIS